MELQDLKEKEIDVKVAKIRKVSVLVSVLALIVLVAVNVFLPVQYVDVNKFLNIIWGGALGVYIGFLFPAAREWFKL